MSEILQRRLPREASVRKATAWVRECYPGSFNDDCSDEIGYTALMFHMCALDALGESAVVHPKIMQGLEPDQIDDAAIYHALQKAAAYQREFFL